MIAYILPWIMGYLVLTLLDRRRQFPRGYRIFAALPVGIGVFTLEVFIFGIFGAMLTAGLFIGILAVDLAALLFIAWITRGFTGGEGEAERGRLSRGEKFLLAAFAVILLLRLFAAAWQVSEMPVYEFDAWNTWDLRGKVIFTEHRIPLDKTDAFYLGGGLNSYPMNDALWKVWVATAVGSWHESAVNLYSVVFYACLIGLFFFSLPRAWKFSFRLLATYALSSLPFLYFHSWIAYADLEFATYSFLAVSALFWFLQSEYRPYLVVAGLGLGLATWTKNEGFAILVPVFLLVTLLLVYKKRFSLRQFALHWAVAFGSALPWLLFRFYNRLGILNGNSGSFKAVWNSQFFGEWFSTVFLRSNFNFLWPLSLILVVWQWKAVCQSIAAKYLAIMLGLLFLVYNGVVLFTDRAYDLSVLARADLQIAPIAVFLCAIILERVVTGELK